MEKKVVLISGASSGIGQKLAIYFANDGYCVGLMARRSQRLKEIEQAIKKKGGVAACAVCDVRDQQQVTAAVDFFVQAWGRIDIVVANAGVSLMSSGDRFNPKIFEKIVQTNLMGAIYLIGAAVPHLLRQQSGQIVGISSLAAFQGLPGAGAYCASKAALSTFLESLRIDLKPHHIDVTVIHPGYIQSPMTDKNRFWMPFLMSLDKGSRQIYLAILQKKRCLSFPFLMRCLVGLGRWVPGRLYDKVMSFFSNEKEDAANEKEDPE